MSDDNKFDLMLFSFFLLFAFLMFAMVCLFSGCTISINAVHTQGEASDVVDETQKTDADIAPNLNFPLTP